TREAVMNAIKHAEAENIWVSLAEREDAVELAIKDDGKGFDTSAAQPEGHFGSVMMRERALVTGGTFTRESALGEGTTIRATFRLVWVEEELLESSPGAEPNDEPPTGPPSDDHAQAKDEEPIVTSEFEIHAPSTKDPSEARPPRQGASWRPPP